MSANPRYGRREAQPVDDIMSRVDKVLGEMGLELTPPSARSAMTEYDKRVAQAAAKIATPEGLVLLEYLADISVRRPVYMAHMNLDPMRAYAIGCQREGQNQLFFTLLAMIQRGREENLEMREGT
jgi:trimethylamine:corrinoid methyltransferase-like protein